VHRLWVPGRNQHAFSEHEGPLLDERNVDIATPPHEPCASNIAIPDVLSAQTRDRIFQLVSKTAQSQIAVPSFPSADCLDKLIKVGIAKRIETDAWIHPFSFCSESAMIEFVTALVAAGCICFGIPSVSRTGLVLQEIVRVALTRLVGAAIFVQRTMIRHLAYVLIERSRQQRHSRPAISTRLYDMARHWRILRVQTEDGDSRKQSTTACHSTCSFGRRIFQANDRCRHFVERENSTGSHTQISSLTRTTAMKTRSGSGTNGCSTNLTNGMLIYPNLEPKLNLQSCIPSLRTRHEHDAGQASQPVIVLF